MKEAKGNWYIAAEALDMPLALLKVRVYNDPQMRAVWALDPDTVKTPSVPELMTRDLEDMPPSVPDKGSDNEIAEAAIRMDREVLRQGLRKSGIKESTIDKLGLMEDMAVNTGRFLAASLDMTHRIMVFQGVSLFEQAEYIKKTYLDDISLPHELRIEWHKVWTEIASEIGKTSDRVLAGTQAAVNMMRKKEDGEGKDGGRQKPGFKPLKRVNKPKDEDGRQG